MTENGFAITQFTPGSIVVHIRCRNSESLNNLQRLCWDGTLDRLFTEVFCPMFFDDGLELLHLVVSAGEIHRCQRVFKEMTLMTDEHRAAMLSSEKWLRDNMTVSDDLLDKLSLCKRRRQAIETATSPQQKVKTLLDIVSRQPLSLIHI